ncbi:hypothetical protein LTR47_011593 [Exophiala xenobiotica]|nr:hypothetical protein LTR92_011270 [Exophiala xenobiotica]KAK5202623.1 hypothetical protein LTR41_011630 [Exophiala xenobiotica]KAK5219262.1 hypothetical protein LTR47_011593 [Exophiala xenobiotica]KAK5243179.1 hypothetical protein LTS06_010998 [Exophiala xenobiotica]KAK5260399.1 hypothetical protein LTR40_004223 [Exophiala xenobiotica]
MHPSQSHWGKITLYDGPGDDDATIKTVQKADSEARPDFLLIVGTSFRLPTIHQLARELLAVVGLEIRINQEPPPKVEGIESVYVGQVPDASHLVAAAYECRYADESGTRSGKWGTRARIYATTQLPTMGRRVWELPRSHAHTLIPAITA